jgi:hypothetical protein
MIESLREVSEGTKAGSSGGSRPGKRENVDRNSAAEQKRGL